MDAVLDAMILKHQAKQFFVPDKTTMSGNTHGNHLAANGKTAMTSRVEYASRTFLMQYKSGMGYGMQCIPYFTTHYGISI